MSFRHCALVLVSILVSTSSAMAMTPGKELSLSLGCNYQNARSAYGSVSLIRLKDGSFLAAGSVELSSMPTVSVTRSYESEDGYTVIQEQQQQQWHPQPEHASVGWDGPRVDTLKEAVSLYRRHMLDIGYQCSYTSRVEVKNW